MSIAKAVRRAIPAPIKARLKRLLPGGQAKAPSITEGWEQYAAAYTGDGQKQLGDEWSVPDVVGADTTAADFVAYLDRKVFAPFIGSCDTLLEIGSGGGRLTAILKPKCRRLIATDTAASMLKLLRQRFAGESGIEYLLLDGKGFPSVQAGTVDVVFTYDVFVHIQHWDFYNYLTEIRRVLKPGGKAVVHHANTFSELGWQCFHAQVPESLNRPKLPYTFTVMTPELVTAFAGRAGLKVERCITDIVRRDCITLLSAPA